MDIKTTATYPYPIWGLPDNYKGDDPAGHRVGLKKNTDENVFILEYEVTTHNEGVDRLITEKRASYLCIIQCSSTYYTQIEKREESCFTVKIPCSKVNKRFSVKIEIVATENIDSCNYLDVDDFYEGVVDYQKGAMIAMVDKFNVSLTPSDDMANLSKFVKYEYANVQKVTNVIDDIILIQLPYSYEDAGKLVLNQCPNVFEAMLVRNALIEAVYKLRTCYDDDKKDWIFYLTQFIKQMVSEEELTEEEGYDYSIGDVLQIVDKILPDVMLNALEEVKEKIEPKDSDS